MSPTPPNVDVTLSRHLADVAGKAARSVQAQLLAAFRSDMTVDTKRDRYDVVTEHDRNVELALRDFILKQVPDSTFIGEEGGSVGQGKVCWYVDPIDGTANFVAGMAFWCVSIGAVIDDRIVAGVVFDPVSGNMFSGNLEGSWLNGKPLRARACLRESEATLIAGYPVARDFVRDGKERALADFAELVEAFRTLRRPGSAALSICHVAAGWVDAAVGFGVNPWDVTAAILILEGAGGSYRPLEMDEAHLGAPAYAVPGYLAQGAGADYPTLRRVCDGISARRRFG